MTNCLLYGIFMFKCAFLATLLFLTHTVYLVLKYCTFLHYNVRPTDDETVWRRKYECKVNNCTVTSLTVSYWQDIICKCSEFYRCCNTAKALIEQIAINFLKFIPPTGLVILCNAVHFADVIHHLFVTRAPTPKDRWPQNYVTS